MTTINGVSNDLSGMFTPLTPLTPDRNTKAEERNSNHIHASPGSVSHMMGLFAPPLAPTSSRSSSNSSLSQSSDSPTNERAPLLGGNATPQPNRDMVESKTTTSDVNKTPIAGVCPSYGSPDGVIGHNAKGSLPNGHARRMSAAKHIRMPSIVMPSISESKAQQGLLGEVDLYNKIIQPNAQSDDDDKPKKDPDTCLGSLSKIGENIVSSLKIPTTYIGSFVYLLYHVVFCLALGSAVMRPHNPVSILGLMTKTAALGTLVASPVYWYCLSQEIPALYPTADLFLASFLAKLALIVDQTLADDPDITEEENDAVFLASFGILFAIGVAMSACLILAAGVFRLANLGSFLPFPVICGFFSAVGISTWMLAINVDTGGQTIGKIIHSHDGELVRYTLLHHIPTIIVAGFMKFLGPKNPVYVCLVVAVTMAIFYIFMFVTGTTLEEMKQDGWFWSHDELVYENSSSTLGFDIWAPPAPLGVTMVLNQVHWGAVQNGISTVVAMSFLYLIRCSVHGAALKKNISNLSRRVLSIKPTATTSELEEDDNQKKRGSFTFSIPVKSRKFSEAVDIEAVMAPPKAAGIGSGANVNSDNNSRSEEASNYQIIRAKSTSVSLKTISMTYAWSQVATAIVGGFAVTPSVASSPTMFTLGADALAPQVGAALLLFLFYLTDFQIVGYIPKPAFSSMLVLAFMDMTYTWFYKSFFKTKDKMEWIVVPIIVFCAFALDLLAAVFLGIASSTFIFVGAFFRSGVVKYTANGQSINSTIERPFHMSDWLNENGDRIQVLCLQNYLFFGNASSIYSYIFALFELNTQVEQSFLKPKSKFLILDLTLVTGMDTSAVDVFTEIRNLCVASNCKLFMCGMSSNIRSILALGGFVPDTGERSKRRLRFFASLDAALGKAEDLLLESHYDMAQTDQAPSRPGMRRLARRTTSGFQKALRHIETEHGENFSRQLAGLEKYTKIIELQSGEALYDDEKERGLFFIEVGILKVEKNTGHTATRQSTSVLGRSIGRASDQKPEAFPRSPNATAGSEFQTFRLARLGVGWVVGTMEFFHQRRPGQEVALDYCKLHHLPFSKIREAEAEDPGLVLELYKLLSYLMAQRQEATIGQLATLHSIMSSPAR
eukprot:CAMPEP_0116130000 /NCGR_PEP_ID=MMETSP0329-20121206/8223_1 /TAXON_ID=697910 /ORGANISM="Pseudo-nitzschia arenysensis, Strain B593" /LENGTH=1118 /DNA_ID=CAMNT_0003624303 /DNA_START=154 /DNA_END=3510 /DNA_ORIENTATION=+